MLASKIVASEERIAWSIQAMFQILKRPSLVSSRPTDIGRVIVGAVMRATSPIAKAHARSAGDHGRPGALDRSSEPFIDSIDTACVASAGDCTKGLSTEPSP